MSTYDNTNKGIFSRNDRKENDSQPDYKGSINVEGVEYWMSGWLRVRKEDGNKFLSLSINKKDQAVAPKTQTKVDFDEDMPF